MKETNEDIQIHKCLCYGVNVQQTIGMLHMTIHYHLEQIYKSNISSANLNEKGMWEFGVGSIIFVLVIIDWWRSSGTYWINLPSLQLTVTLTVLHRSYVTCSSQMRKKSRRASRRRPTTHRLTCAIKLSWLINQVLPRSSTKCAPLRHTSTQKARRYCPTEYCNQIGDCSSCHMLFHQHALVFAF